MKELLPNLQEFDSNWIGIPPQQVKTTGRNLVHRLNVKLGRFKMDFNKIEKIIMDLPEEHEPTVEHEGVSNPDNTESEADHEEIKRPASFNTPEPQNPVMF